MVLFSRSLYALVFVLMLLTGAGVVWPISDFKSIQADKIKVPKVKVDDFKSYKEISIPLVNVFDPEGKDWKKQRVVKSSKSNGSEKMQDIKGILQLPSLSGVLTDNGFVAVGEKLSGWELLSVNNGKAVLQKQGKKIDIWVDKSRKKRKIQFEKMGFPFLK